MRKKGSKKWLTEEQVNLAKLLSDNGLSIQKIAESLNISWATVHALKKAGFNLETYRLAQREYAKKYEKKPIAVESTTPTVPASPTDNSVLLELIVIKSVLREIAENTRKKRMFS